MNFIDSYIINDILIGCLIIIEVIDLVFNNSNNNNNSYFRTILFLNFILLLNIILI